MQKYVKNYMEHFGYGEQSIILCEYCSRQGSDLHHIIYRSQGGSDDVQNIIALCRQCHNQAHNKTLTAKQLQDAHSTKIQHKDNV